MERDEGGVAVRSWRLKWSRKDGVVRSKGKTKKSAKVKCIQVMCALYTRGGRVEGLWWWWGAVPWLQHGHYWLFLCSVRLAGASVAASPRAAFERTSAHLA